MRVIGLFLMIILLVACKPQVPSDYLSPGQMEDILYDYHLAMAIAQTQGSSDPIVMQEEYKLAVLEKYGVTEVQFEESLQYYYRHTERLHDIYEKLSERMSNEALANGASASDINKYNSLKERGDTIDIWTDRRALVFSPQPPFNAVAFHIVADSTFHQGDCLEFHFDSQYIVQEGQRSGIAVLSVKYTNDSITTQTQHVNSNVHYRLNVDNPGRLAIREIRGYIMMLQGENELSNSLKLLFLTNIHLIKMRTKQAELSVTDTLSTDSLSADDGEVESQASAAFTQSEEIPTTPPNSSLRQSPPSGQPKPTRHFIPDKVQPATRPQVIESGRVGTTEKRGVQRPVFGT